MGVTSLPNAARIGSGCAGGAGSALVCGHECLSHSSEGFESARAKEMAQELVTSKDDVGDPILDGGTPNYAPDYGSLLLLQ